MNMMSHSKIDVLSPKNEEEEKELGLTQHIERTYMKMKAEVWLTHWQSKDSVRLPDTCQNMAQILPDSLQKETIPLTP